VQEIKIRECTYRACGNILFSFSVSALSSSANASSIRPITLLDLKYSDLSTLVILLVSAFISRAREVVIGRFFLRKASLA